MKSRFHVKLKEYRSVRFGTGAVPEVLKRAIKFGRNKKATAIESFNASADSAKRTAFSAAGDLSNKSISTILKSANTSIANGQTFSDFKKSLPPEIFNRISAPEIVFKNQAIDTYQRSRFNQQTRLAPLRPFWQYVTFGDDRVRPNHALMNGIVSPANSSFWANNYPPNGHQCRCTARALNERQVRQRNLKVYDTQKSVDRAKFAEQSKAGIPKSKQIRPIADPGGWRTSYRPGELELETVRQAFKPFNPDRFKSIVSNTVPRIEIVKAATETRDNVRANAVANLKKQANIINVPAEVPTESIKDIADGFAAAQKIGGNSKLKRLNVQNLNANGTYTPDINTISINKRNAIGRRTIQEEQSKLNASNREKWTKKIDSTIKELEAAIEAQEFVEVSYLKIKPGTLYKKRTWETKLATTKRQAENALKIYREYKDVYGSIKRWSVSQDLSGKLSQVYKTSAHEYFHSISFRAGVQREWDRNLVLNNVSKVDRASVSEYAVYSGREEAFAETGAAIVADLPVPANLKKAFENTIKKAKENLK